MPKILTRIGAFFKDFSKVTNILNAFPSISIQKPKTPRTASEMTTFLQKLKGSVIYKARFSTIFLKTNLEATKLEISLKSIITHTRTVLIQKIKKLFSSCYKTLDRVGKTQ